MLKGKKIINIVGASGSGKTTLGKELKNIGIPELVSHTSREIRLHDGEQEGVAYYFTTKEAIIEMDNNNELVEHVVYSGNHYALSKKEVDKKFEISDIVFAITDKVGNKHLKDIYGEDMIETIFVFIDTDTLAQRLRDRGDSEEVISARIENIEKTKELENYKIADYVILNKDYDKAKKQLLFIVDMIKQSLV